MAFIHSHRDETQLIFFPSPMRNRQLSRTFVIDKKGNVSIWMQTGVKKKILNLRQSGEDSRCLGVYHPRPLAVIEDEAPRYHGCAIHFYRHRNRLMIWRNKGM